MSSFQSSVGLPPLSSIAAVTHEPTGISASIAASTPALSATVEYRDARIKDPVPKKLKGQASNIKGNFGVIQMDLSGHDTSLERDELAKRASESTELAAMRAYQSGHGVSSMKRFVRLPDDTSVWDSYYAASTTTQAAQATQATQASQATQPENSKPSPRTQPLTPTETKEEQARLLTLLRSLSPTSVVDQICKALAYFGGIPDAAPPTDGVFPRSELENGSGSLFVGWVAEIFPKLPNETTHHMKTVQHLDSVLAVPTDSSAGITSASATSSAALAKSKTPGPGQPLAEDHLTASQPVSSSTATVVPGKRRRGRPKGSKATKVRRDKGIKKGPVKARRALAAAAAAAAAAAGSGAIHGAISSGSNEVQPSMHLAQSSGSRNAEGDSWVEVEDSVLNVTGSGDVGIGGNLFFPTNTTSATNSNSAPDGRAVSTLPVVLDNLGSSAGGRTETNGHAGESGKKRGRPKGSKNRPKVVESDSTTRNTIATPATVTPIPPPEIPGPPISTKRAAVGRPKGTTSKPKDSLSQAAPATTNGDQDFGFSHLQQQLYDMSNPIMESQSTGQAPDAATVSTGGVKRKRGKASKNDEIVTVDLSQGYPATNGGHIGMTSIGNQPSQPAELVHATTTPLSKRQRKSVASAQNGSNSSVSPATNSSGGNVASLGAAATSLSGDTQILPSLDAADADSQFGAVTFETLSSHLGQDASASLVSQHQSDRVVSLSSQHHHQLPSQQQNLAQKTPSATPPLQGADQMQGRTIGRIQNQPQQHQQSRQTQPQHSHRQASNHSISSAPSQHSSQTHLSGSMMSGPIASQQLPRPSRTPQPFYAQSRPSNGQFGQSQPSPQQQQQPPQPQPQQQAQQPQHQPHKQHFASQYQQSAQQYTPQPAPQTFTPLQRHPSHSLSASSPVLMAQNTSHRSPQFGATNTTSLGTASNAYGTGSAAGTMNFSSSSYGQPRRTNTAGSPSLNGAYGTTGAAPHGLSHHGSPSFGTTRPQPLPSASHAQNVTSTAQSIQNFHSFDSQSLFDSISLDATAGGGSLGLSGAAAYGLGGTIPRTTSNSAAYGTATSINSFDTGMGSNNLRDRFYGVRR